jgi:hypothetical protein
MLFHDMMHKKIEVYIDYQAHKTRESCLYFKEVVREIKEVQTKAQPCKMFIWS